MNTNPANPTDLSGLEMDLLKSFQPSWVKESTSPGKISQVSSRDEDAGSSAGGFDRDDADFRWNRKPPKSERLTRKHGSEHAEKLRRPSGDKRPPERSSAPRSDSRQEPDRRQQTAEPRGVDGLLKQIKSTAKTYSLFELARLVLEKSARYLVEFKRTGGPALFQVVADGTLWLSEGDAVARVLSANLDAFYRRERIAVEPPKAASPIIAQCGMSGVFLGPPNLHDYQPKVQKLHAERFSHVPFDIYKARIRMVRDEESIQKWRDEQSSQDVFFPLETPEGIEPVPLKNLAEVGEHFQKNHAASAITNPGEQFTVPGSAPVNDSATAVIEFTRRELDSLIRFPLPLANFLSQKLAAGGLQIFKAHENITYVSVARPRLLDRQANPVSESLAAILDYLESNPGKPRSEQWRALLELPTLPTDASLREPALLRDFHWLLLQGHVIDFASKGLEIPRRPSPRPPQEKPQGARPPRPNPAPKPRQPVHASTPAIPPVAAPMEKLSSTEKHSAVDSMEHATVPAPVDVLPDAVESLPEEPVVIPVESSSIAESAFSSPNIAPLPANEDDSLGRRDAVDEPAPDQPSSEIQVTKPVE